MRRLFPIVLAAAALLAAEGYHIITRYKIGGTGGWDYLTVDNSSRRLFVSHANQVEVLDLETGAKVGVIPETPGVHGIAIAADLNTGFITSGRSNAVVIFDLKTLKKTGEAKTGANPDAVCYEPKTRRVFAFNHSGGSATAIDAKNGQPLSTFEVGPAPEFCVVDGAGKVYANIEDSAEVVEIDAGKAEVTRRASLAPCERPTGLAIDVKNRKLFSSCSKVMAVTDIATMKVIATPAIGAGADGAGFDSGLGLAISSNGRDGTLSIVKAVNGRYETVDTVKTAPSARTMAVDEKTHRVYVSFAEYGPAAAGGGRAPVLPESFGVLVVGK